MTNTIWRARLGLALLAITGCAGGDDALARTEASLDVLGCYGSETVCDPAKVPSEELVMPATRSCDGEIGPALERDFLVGLPDLDVCYRTNEGPGCTRSNALHIGVVLGPDNVSWWLQTGSKALLARYDAEGRLLGTTDLEPLVSADDDPLFYGADITVDERGHAFVVMHTAYEVDEHTRGWLIELDPEGQPVRDATRVGAVGFMHVAPASDGVAMAGNLPEAQRHGVLAKLARDGARVWSQSDVRTHGRIPLESGGVTALASDASGHMTLVSEREARAEGRSWGVTRFDAAGNALWDRVFDLPHDEYAGDAHLKATGDGSVTVASLLSHGPAQGMDRFDEVLTHVRADGSADWAYRFESAWALAYAAHPRTGDVYVSVQGVGLEAAFPDDYLAVISADGERCTRYPVLAVPGEPIFPRHWGAIRDLTVDGEGRVYGTAMRHTVNEFDPLKIDEGFGRWRVQPAAVDK